MNMNQIALAATQFTPSTKLDVPQALLVSVIGIFVVMFELALLAGFILLMAQIFKLAAKAKKQPEAPAAVSPVTQPVPAKNEGTPLPDNNSAGKLELIDVDEPTAAVVMAIVSNQSGIPLNRLSFKSIKKLEDK